MSKEIRDLAYSLANSIGNKGKDDVIVKVKNYIPDSDDNPWTI